MTTTDRFIQPLELVKVIKRLGGLGSGNFGHAGRPGEIGGSAPAGSRPLSKDDREALDSYGFARTGNTINNMLREGSIDNFARERKIVETLDRLMVKGNALTVHRALPARIVQALSPGDTFSDKGFTSTTKDKNAVEQFRDRYSDDEEKLVVLIHVPAEVPRLDTTDYERSSSMFTVENNEVILPRDSVFQVVSTNPWEVRVEPPKEGYADERRLGGPGSGNFGHAGRPGQVGGSAPDETYVDDGGSSWSPMSNSVLKEMLDLHTERSPSVQTLLKELKRRAKKGDARARQVHDETIDRLKAYREVNAIAEDLVGKWRETGKEYGVALDSKGTLLGRSEGTEDSVDFPETLDRQDSSIRAQWHHNHPYEASLSTGDMIALANTPAVERIYAHTETATYSAARVPGKERELYSAAKDVFAEKYKEALDGYLEHGDRERLRQESRASQHFAMLELHKRGLVVYTSVARKTRSLEFRAAKKPEPAKVQFNKVNTRAVTWARKHSAELVTDVTETSRKAIKRAIANLLEGENYNVVLSQIEKAIGDDDRAELIARHETMAAVSAGQREAWREAQEEGLIPGGTQRVWIITPLNPCPDCEALDGAVADIDGFYPDGSLGPPRHPRCRCTEGLA